MRIVAGALLYRQYGWIKRLVDEAANAKKTAARGT
jgi:hypothetical protein